MKRSTQERLKDLRLSDRMIEKSEPTERKKVRERQK